MTEDKPTKLLPPPKKTAKKAGKKAKPQPGNIPLPGRLRHLLDIIPVESGCGCGCGELPRGKSTFIQGHDRRLLGYCVAVYKYGVPVTIIPRFMWPHVSKWDHLEKDVLTCVCRAINEAANG